MTFLLKISLNYEQRKHYLLAEIESGQLVTQIQGVQKIVQHFIGGKVTSKKSGLIS